MLGSPAPAIGDPQSADDKPASSYARKVPKQKKVADIGAQNRHNLWHQATCRTVDALLKEPSIALEVWGSVEALFIAKRKERVEPNESEHWNPQYKKIWRLPTYFMGSWLVATSKGKLDEKHLNRMAEFHGGDSIVRAVFFACTCTDGSDVLPAEALSKHVCAKAFAIRHARTGSRLMNFIDHAMHDDGSIEWHSGGGPYKIDYVDDHARRITHSSGDYVDIAIHGEGSFDNSWRLHDGFSDMRAMVKGKRIGEIKLHSYFGADTGPHRPEFAAGTFEEQCKRAAQILSSQKTMMEKDKVEENKDMVSETRQLKRQKALQQARRMLANKRVKAEQGSPMVKAEVLQSAPETSACAAASDSAAAAAITPPNTRAPITPHPSN